MAEYTCNFKHKIYYNIQQNLAKNFTFSRGVFRTRLKVRSSRLEVFCRKDLLRNFTKFTGKHLCQSACNFIEKETLAQVFSCEFWEISKNSFFTEHFRWLLLKRLSKGDVYLEVTIFTKNFILDV